MLLLVVIVFQRKTKLATVLVIKMEQTKHKIEGLNLNITTAMTYVKFVTLMEMDSLSTKKNEISDYLCVLMMSFFNKIL